ncbi:patatin-like phospholipase family protein [Occultella aeris]|uniref:Patatin-like phospholipase n=1 Tax=Occultella aeris TaxID=2761496 RepID=A0A7M4DIA1_9MICO|nr:patatin-like phospholipase family protein [Occultella aeris]VZO36669.1 Patatin-like phospholipase [Occultella aeris]
MSTDWSDPTLECDLVMKGGITSGVIYPRAVTELARTYRLRSVGGASAGAIAAAAAAAAELGRGTGGFAELERMPDDITAPSPAGGSTLFRLFQPTRAAAPLFGVATAGMGSKGSTAVRAKALATLRWFWWALVLGALPGVVLAVLAGVSGGGGGRWAGVAAGVVLALLGAVFGLVICAAGLLGRLQGWGMCTGMAGYGGKGAPALTPWLHERIQTMAGRGGSGSGSSGEAPVTFGQLADAGITLRMMTTNVTRYQPMAMPWDSGGYYIDPAVWRRYFPEDVVAWIEQHPSAVTGSTVKDRYAALTRAHAGRRALVPFPAPRDVPVVVATRMSLSFPVLISAVPLESIDFSRGVNTRYRKTAEAWLGEHPDAGIDEALAAIGAAPEFEPNWFSDGGLCANLPVHFFDSPLPRRPTFAINLGQLAAGRKPEDDQAKNTFLPTHNAVGALRHWHTLTPSGLGGLLGFAHALVTTSQVWVDNAQLVLPGYRDRVVTIYHSGDEGGMNLSMPKDIVDALAARGRAGAAKLVDQFAGDDPGGTPGFGFENHRWIRMRTSATGLGNWLGAWGAGYRTPVAGATDYAELAGPGAAAPLPSYKPGAGARDRINHLVGELLTLIDDWGADDAVAKGSPRPTPRLRLVPEEGVATFEAPTVADLDAAFAADTEKELMPDGGAGLGPGGGPGGGRLPY